MKPKSRPELEKAIARRAKGEDTLASAADLLQGLMSNAAGPLSAGFFRLRLEQNWQQVIGARWATHTAPATFDRGVLEVWVAHPALSVELQFVKGELVQKVNQFLKAGAVCKDVRFTTHRRQSASSV